MSWRPFPSGCVALSSIAAPWMPGLQAGMPDEKKSIDPARLGMTLDGYKDAASMHPCMGAAGTL